MDIPHDPPSVKLRKLKSIDSGHRVPGYLELKIPLESQQISISKSQVLNWTCTSLFISDFFENILMQLGLIQEPIFTMIDRLNNEDETDNICTEIDDDFLLDPENETEETEYEPETSLDDNSCESPKLNKMVSLLQIRQKRDARMKQRKTLLKAQTYNKRVKDFLTAYLPIHELLYQILQYQTIYLNRTPLKRILLIFGPSLTKPSRTYILSWDSFPSSSEEQYDEKWIQRALRFLKRSMMTDSALSSFSTFGRLKILISSGEDLSMKMSTDTKYFSEKSIRCWFLVQFLSNEGLSYESIEFPEIPLWEELSRIVTLPNSLQLYFNQNFCLKRHPIFQVKLTTSNEELQINENNENYLTFQLGKALKFPWK